MREYTANAAELLQIHYKNATKLRSVPAEMTCQPAASRENHGHHFIRGNARHRQENLSAFLSVRPTLQVSARTAQLDLDRTGREESGTATLLISPPWPCVRRKPRDKISTDNGLLAAFQNHCP